MIGLLSATVAMGSVLSFSSPWVLAGLGLVSGVGVSLAATYFSKGPYLNQWSGTGTGAVVCVASLVIIFLLRLAYAMPQPRTIYVPDSEWHNQPRVVKLVPAIPLPSRAGKDRDVDVFVRLSCGGRISVGSIGSRRTLVYPAGTIVDRVEYANVDGARLIEDVRGTHLDRNERLYFRIFRPKTPGVGAPLVGYEWPADSSLAGGVALSHVTDRMWSGGGFARTLDGSELEREIRGYEKISPCASCHPKNKEPSTSVAEPAAGRHATDDLGFYTPMMVLRSDGPAEDFEGRDRAGDSKYVTVWCDEKKTIPAQRVGGPGDVRQYRCPTLAVPIAHIDIRRALKAGDQHARAVCESREALREYLDVAAVEAFSEAFEECEGGR